MAVPSRSTVSSNVDGGDTGSNTAAVAALGFIYVNRIFDV